MSLQVSKFGIFLLGLVIYADPSLPQIKISLRLVFLWSFPQKTLLGFQCFAEFFLRFRKFGILFFNVCSEFFQAFLRRLFSENHRFASKSPVQFRQIILLLVDFCLFSFQQFFFSRNFLKFLKILLEPFCQRHLLQCFIDFFLRFFFSLFGLGAIFLISFYLQIQCIEPIFNRFRFRFRFRKDCLFLFK